MKDWPEELGLDGEPQVTPEVEGESQETPKVEGESQETPKTEGEPQENPETGGGSQAVNEALAAGESNNNEDIGELDAAREDEEFWNMVEGQEGEREKKPKGGRGRGGKKNDCSCSAPPRKPVAPATPPPPKDPPNDLPLLVVLTNYNVQKEYPAGTTLEEVRQDLEMDYPAYSDKNTSWYFEEQREKNRVLCIPSVKSNKAG